jgi:TRAP-type mannitol/chloroaromatic compound transport system substrate-binding protein
MRRSFLKLSALGLGIAASGIARKNLALAENSKGPRIKWKMCTTWSPKLPILQESAELFSKMVEEASGGRFKIKVFAGGELIPPLETFDAVSNGSVEMGAGAAYYWQGKIKASPFFCAIPFGMNAQMQNIWLDSGGGLKLWRELYAPHNLVPFAFGNTGAQMAGWFKTEINSVQDLKGIKIRIPGLGGTVMAEAGANVVLMPGGELYTALERGTIDATEWVNPFHDERLGFYRAAKNYYYPGWQEPGAILELSVNRQKWEKLPLDLQRIVEICAAYINSWVLQRSEAENGPALIRLTKEHGVKVRPLPADVLSHLREVSFSVVENLANADSFAKIARNSHSEFLKKSAEWNTVSNISYYTDVFREKS